MYPPALVALNYYNLVSNAENWLDIDQFMGWVSHRIQSRSRLGLASDPQAGPSSSSCHKFNLKNFTATVQSPPVCSPPRTDPPHPTFPSPSTPNSTRLQLPRKRKRKPSGRHDNPSEWTESLILLLMKLGLSKKRRVLINIRKSPSARRR